MNCHGYVSFKAIFRIRFIGQEKRRNWGLRIGCRSVSLIFGATLHEQPKGGNGIGERDSAKVK